MITFGRMVYNDKRKAKFNSQKILVKGVLIQQEKLQQLPQHPAHQQLQEQTKNRLKRGSFNHLAKGLLRTHNNILPNTAEEREPLQNSEEWKFSRTASSMVPKCQG